MAMTMQMLIFLYLVPSCYGQFGYLQTVGVRGRITCHGKGAADVIILLKDREIAFDVEMERYITQRKSDGNFNFTGSKREFSYIEPELHIYFKCNYKNVLRKELSEDYYRKIYIEIPQQYISQGEFAKNYYHVYLELAGRFPEETIGYIVIPKKRRHFIRFGLIKSHSHARNKSQK